MKITWMVHLQVQGTLKTLYAKELSESLVWNYVLLNIGLCNCAVNRDINFTLVLCCKNFERPSRDKFSAGKFHASVIPPPRVTLLSCWFVVKSTSLSPSSLSLSVSLLLVVTPRLLHSEYREEVSSQAISQCHCSWKTCMHSFTR